MRTAAVTAACLVISALCIQAGQAEFSTPTGKDQALGVYKPTKFNTYTEYGGLWRTDRTFESTIRLSNQLSISPIDATVTLYMADGTPYVLPPVHLNASGVTTVNVNDALQNAPEAILPHLSSFGSASISYKYDWQGVVYAQMSMLDIPRSLQYSYPFMFPMSTMSNMAGMQQTKQTKPSAGPTALEGLIWSYSRNSKVFLSFANTSKQDIDVRLSVLGNQGEATDTRRFTVPAMNTSLQELKPGLFNGLDEEIRKGAGGVRIEFNSDADSMSVFGGIEDDEHGYSANVPINQVVKGGGVTTVAFASPGVMVGKQDAMMGFPEHLRFEPYAYFRNVSDTPIELTGNVYYGAAQSAALPALTLPPHQSRRLPVKEVIGSLGVNGSVTLAFSYQGPQGALLVADGAVDQSGNYVFEAEARTTAETASKTSIYWTIANGFDTMYSLWNPGGKPEDLLLKFQYAPGKTYSLPVHLDGHAQTMVDLKQIAMQGTPDAKGQVLPLTATSGALVITGISGDVRDSVNLSITSGIYNPVTATCGYGCETCNGCTNFGLSPDPAYIGIGQNYQLNSYCVWEDGTEPGYTTSSNWGSDATSVVTIQNDPSWGLAYGQGGGSTTAWASFYAPANMGQICAALPLPQCQNTNAAPSTPANVVVPSYETVSVGGRIAHNGDSVTSPDGQVVIPAPCYGYSRSYTYQIYGTDGKPFTTSGTQSKETNTTTSSNPSSLKLTPTVTDGTSNGMFYDVQANCTNVPPGPPTGTYVKGNQQLDVIVGGTTYPQIRMNSIDMEATDVTVTCTANCH
jgi:hypothetical protein